MAQHLIITKSLILCFAIASLVGCGNVRFSASPSTADGIANGGPSDNNGGDPGGGGPNDTGIDPGIGGGGNPTPTPTPVNGVFTYTHTVPPAINDVDFLLIVDNSTSMEADQVKMANQMLGFANAMSQLNIDWQMCLTTTTFVNNTFGHSVAWQGYTPPAGGSPYVLKKGAANLSQIFAGTIPAIGSSATAGDERGIKAAYNHFSNGVNGVANGRGCYRPGSAKVVIILSDEDERSVAGDCNRIKPLMGETKPPEVPENQATCRQLEAEDQPANLIQHTKNLFGSNVRFTFNSIVVDTDACEAAQDALADAKGFRYPAHKGTKYIQASNLTNGGVGSLCDNDFKNNFNLFKDKLTNTVSSIDLQCAPNPINTLSVKIDNVTKNIGTDYAVSGKTITFSTPVNQGNKIDLSYRCD